MYGRYAVYYAPEPGPFADFTAAWLGWDPARGTPVPHPDLPLDIPAVVATPRKYGFHGTLKPPFRLAEGVAETDLRAALDRLAADMRPLTLPGLRLDRLGPFLALLPEGDPAALAHLAARVVQELDHLRAPLTPEEQARRKPESLTPRQRKLLEEWGYPHVMDQFRFHLTLTGPLPGDQADTVMQVLAPRLVPLLPVPFLIRDLCLFGEAADGHFRLLHRAPLTGG